MHRVRGFFRFVEVDGMIPADPAICSQPPGTRPRVRTQDLDRLEVRFLTACVRLFTFGNVETIRYDTRLSVVSGGLSSVVA